jgi:uncharacterized oligopeptide transporter (OPT) family protein
MDLIFIIPGVLISLLILIAVNRRFKLIKMPQIKPEKWQSFVQEWDTLKRNLCFIGFFCMVFVGIWMIFKPAAYIICGIAGLWFCFPRGEGK